MLRIASGYSVCDFVTCSPLDAAASERPEGRRPAERKKREGVKRASCGSTSFARSALRLWGEYHEGSSAALRLSTCRSIARLKYPEHLCV
jgi:hypothetical protein